MAPLQSIDESTLSTWLAEQGESRFRCKQILNWIYQKGAVSFETMTDLSKSLRDRLTATFRLRPLELVREVTSQDGETTKFLWKLWDGRLVESVLIRAPGRRTVCVSSQVGCPARCAFCASGKQGLMRNLDAGEITMQVVETARLLEPQGERVSHVVFMGMGEPFENYDAVLSSIRLLVHPDIMAMSQRHLTVSTVGIPSQIRRFADEGLKVNLVLSLHAPNQRIRQKIIPYARKYPIEELLESMLYFARTTRRDITYEYTLLAGINDRYEDAEELARLVRGHPCTVNLIPYNPVEGLRLDRPSGATIESFRAVLEEAGLSVTWRYTKGKEIAAACGQLALHTTQESARAEKVATAIS